MADENDADITCPHCSERFDEWTVYEYNTGRTTPRCPSCNEAVAFEDWLST